MFLLTAPRTKSERLQSVPTKVAETEGKGGDSAASPVDGRENARIGIVQNPSGGLGPAALTAHNICFL